MDYTQNEAKTANRVARGAAREGEKSAGKSPLNARLLGGIMFVGLASLKEKKMGHIVRLQSREQFVAAIGVLNQLPGMWHSRGPEETPTLLVLDSHYKALVKAGVISSNGKEGNARGKKATAKKAKS